MMKVRAMTLKTALLKLRKAETAMWEALRHNYPVKAPIKWYWRGATVQTGFVEHHGFGDRIKVCNERTGNSTWIHAYNVAEQD